MLDCHPAECRVTPSLCYFSFLRLLKTLASGLLEKGVSSFVQDLVLDQQQNGPELGLESGARALRLPSLNWNQSFSILTTDLNLDQGEGKEILNGLLGENSGLAKGRHHLPGKGAQVWLTLSRKTQGERGEL